jgi:hypothetical protein
VVWELTVSGPYEMERVILKLSLRYRELSGFALRYVMEADRQSP